MANDDKKKKGATLTAKQKARIKAKGKPKYGSIKYDVVVKSGNKKRKIATKTVSGPGARKIVTAARKNYKKKK